MNNLKDYILEKLVIDDELAKEHEERNYYFTADIADEIDMPKWAYDFRQLKNGKRNRLWYAVYIYLYKNGPQKGKDVISYLKPGASGYEGRFMTELRNYRVIKAGTGKDRGLQFIESPDKWSDFTHNSYIC